jgi:FG-GAP-like repeat
VARRFKLAIVRAKQGPDTISDQACRQMLMVGPGSVLRFWSDTTGGFLDFVDSAMFPWVDVTLTAGHTSRNDQAVAAFAALRRLDPNRDPLAGFDGALVITHPGQVQVPNPQAGQPGQPATIPESIDGGSTGVNGLPVAVVPVMSSDHTFMCHELGHTLGFAHTFGLVNNGIDWAPADPVVMEGPEYGSPYDLMSSASFGSRGLGTGPHYFGNPTFAGSAVAGWPNAGAQQMGPHLSRANLHLRHPEALNGRAVDGRLPDPGQIVRLRLAATSSGNGGPSLFVIRPRDESPTGAGRIYVEYRDTRSWDQGMHVNGTDLAQAGLVMHTLEDVANVGPRTWYRGSVGVGATQTDFVVPTRPVTVTLHEFGETNGQGWADISVRHPSTILRQPSLLWANVSDGAMQLWMMCCGRVTRRANVVNEVGQIEHIGAPWRIIGTGDFNRDGHVDILWANAADGSMQIWFMDEGRVAGRATVVNEVGQPERIGSPWHVVGVADFAPDGRADILWMNAFDGTLQLWQMEGATVARRATIVNERQQPEHVGAPWRIVGVGDFTGNHNADILWANTADASMQIWSMNGAQVAARITVVGENGLAERIGAPWRIVGIGDYNRDDRADILWHNVADGAMQIWQMDGGRVQRRVNVVAENGVPERVGAPWHLVGNGVPRRADVPGILWYHDSTGEIQNWLMQSMFVAGRTTILGENGQPVFIGPPWHIVATRDLNLDGSQDILWHNSVTGEIQIWFMNGHQVGARATVVDEAGQPAPIGPPWHIVAAADFNLNGIGDILWHNATTGETQIWFMNGHQRAGRATVLGEDGNPAFVGPPWRIVGAGDFNLNGSADILWHNDATGETQIWFVERGRVTSRATVLGENGNPALIGPPWHIVGTRDFNLDGMSDILWHNDATGETQIWFMNGARVASRGTVIGENGQPAFVGPPFRIVGA